MTCVEAVFGAVTAILILAGVAVSSNVATVFSGLIFFVNAGLFGVVLYSLHGEDRLRLRLFYRSKRLPSAQQQHLAVFFFLLVLLSKVCVVGWQLTLESGEHTDVESQVASMWRALQGTYFLLLALFVHYSDYRERQVSTECCSAETGLFFSLSFTQFIEIVSTILVWVQYYRVQNPLFPVGLVVAQAVYVAWSVVYTWILYFGLLRALGCGCKQHEGTLVSESTGVVSIRSEPLLDDL